MTRWLPLLALLATACTPTIYLWPVEKSSASPQPSTGVANPATLYCQSHNGRPITRPSLGQGETGYCVFTDLSYCEEWAYYRQQCKPGESPIFQ